MSSLSSARDSDLGVEGRSGAPTFLMSRADLRKGVLKGDAPSPSSLSSSSVMSPVTAGLSCKPSRTEPREKLPVEPADPRLGVMSPVTVRAPLGVIIRANYKVSSTFGRTNIQSAVQKNDNATENLLIGHELLTERCLYKYSMVSP